MITSPAGIKTLPASDISRTVKTAQPSPRRGIVAEAECPDKGFELASIRGASDLSRRS